MKCCRGCVRLAILLSDTSLGKTVEYFMQDIRLLKLDPAILQTFYEYVSSRYMVSCETGIAFIERVVMSNTFCMLLDTGDSVNMLVNQKMRLYRWIRPEHLEIEASEERLSECATSFLRISGPDTPTDKIDRFMRGVEELQGILGRSEGQDRMLPALIYCLIKSGTEDLYLHIRFMKTYQRRAYPPCCPGCTHGVGAEIKCSSGERRYDEQEVAYYLTTALAAAEFIEKMEFYDLRVGEEEFNENIEEAMRHHRPGH
jgi:Rab5 GDP/GTP exchange factor